MYAAAAVMRLASGTENAPTAENGTPLRRWKYRYPQGQAARLKTPLSRMFRAAYWV